MDEDTMRMIAETHIAEKIALRMRISELEAALRRIIEHSKMKPLDWMFASIEEAEKLVQ